MKSVIIHCDGLCEPNPGGVACWAFCVFLSETSAPVAEHFGCLLGRDTTNNLAEYAALEWALKWLQKKRESLVKHRAKVFIRTDSKLLVEQMNGRWACNAPTLREFRHECRQRLQTLTEIGIDVAIEWVPREQNEEADALSRQAYIQMTGNEVPSRPEWQKRKKAKV